MKKPKHIFLVHGEPEGQLVLKDKIIETTNINVTIPSFGEKYELNDDINVIDKIELKSASKYTRLQILDRMQTLKEELEDMSDIVKEEMLTETAKDEELEKLNEKMKELERQIVKIVENKE